VEILEKSYGHKLAIFSEVIQLKAKWKAVLEFGYGHLTLEYISMYNMERCNKRDADEIREELYETEQRV
jgi:hypothetical protein